VAHFLCDQTIEKWLNSRLSKTLVNVELKDIHLTERNGKNNYSYMLIRNGKGNKSRKIPLSVDVTKAIRDYLEVRPTTLSKKLLIGQRGAFTRLAVNSY
jgi:integrase/recombinase XerD